MIRNISLTCKQTTEPSIWLTLTARQTELLVWQLIMDLGGEISTIPADDVPGRRLLFSQDGEHITMTATEDFEDE